MEGGTDVTVHRSPAGTLYLIQTSALCNHPSLLEAEQRKLNNSAFGFPNAASVNHWRRTSATMAPKATQKTPKAASGPAEKTGKGEFVHPSAKHARKK